MNRDKTQAYLNHPTTGNIYIFQEGDTFAPMRLDSITNDQLFMRNYIFLFAEGIPTKTQILTEEFDLNFYAIYQKKEMNRLYEEGKLVKIYRAGATN